MSLSISKAMIIIAILLLMTQPVLSGQLEDGFVAYKNGDIELAQKEWLALSIKGSVRAQFFLSVLLENKANTQENISNSKRWLTASANNGFVPAQFNLGNNFHKGKYGQVNIKMAEYWWNQAAVQGFPEAQYHLATLYYWGKPGVNLDKKEASYWFEQAAKGGYKDAVDARLLMRAGEPLPPPAAYGPDNIPYDDPRIVSKLSLDSKQTVETNGEKQQIAAPPRHIETAKQIAAPKPHPSEKPGIDNKKGVTDSQGKGWISQQPASNYTIQLLASTRVKECKSHKSEMYGRYRLETHIQSFMKGGREYCAVIFGSYGSYSAAKSKLKQLPAKIRRAKPWMRKIAR